MARILIGWDLGGGLGHITNMVAVGRALAARGHRVSLAVPHPPSAAAPAREAGLPVLAAPASRERLALPPGQGPFRARSLSDVLLLHGWGDPAVLEPQVRAWQGLVDTLRPDLVLAEFSPLLCLAARGRVPVASFGIGYCLPCLDDEGRFPVFEPAARALAPASVLEASVAATARALGLDCPAQPLSLLLGDAQWHIGLDLIDPYRAWRPAPGIGPLWPVPASTPPLPGAPACLVYLPAEHPAMGALLQGLAGLGLPGHAFVRGGTPAMREALSAAGLAVSAAPLPMDEVLAQVSVVVHHGGIGTVARCLAWGRPQVVIPQVLEQELAGRILEAEGLATVVLDRDRALRVGELARAAASSPEMAARTAAESAALRARYPGNGLETLVAACERLAGGR